MNDKDLSKIDGLNDRRNLLLLTYKKVRTVDDENVITILLMFYPDFADNHIEAIRNDLSRRGLMDLMDMHPDMPQVDEEGNETEKYGWMTTNEGENALKTNLFPSEMKKRNEDKKRQEMKDKETELNIRSLKRSKWSIWLSVAAIIISAITLLSELGLIKQWLPYLWR